jgi:septation ring formation regulator EzrA
MGIVAVLVVGSIGTIVHRLSADIQALSAELAVIRGTQQHRGERVAALEAQAAANRDNIATIKGDIEYIKRRVDELIQRGTGREKGSAPY